MPVEQSESERSKLLAQAAQALSANERDLSAWWRLADVLDRVGEDATSLDAFAKLGKAANELGAVALAIACVVRTRNAGGAKEADALMKQVGATHGLGSSRVREAKNSSPPEPPSIPPPGTSPLPEGLKASKKVAADAIVAAGKAAMARAPKTLRLTPLIRYLSPGDMASLVSVMTLKRYECGEVIIDLGDSADSLYWVARGSAEVSRSGKLLGELRDGDFFGEIALMGATTRTARVACLEDTYLLVIPASAVGDMAVKSPNLAKVLATHARARLLSNVTRTSEIFRRLSEEEKRLLVPRFESRFAEDGELLIECGKENDSLYVVVSGQCEVRNEGSVIATLSVGDGFGEMSMLGRKPATSDVIAMGSVVLLWVSRDKFDTIAVAHPELLAEVYGLLVSRERENSDAIIHDAADLVI